MVLLVDVKSNKLVGYQKLSQNSRFEKVALKFLAPKEGVVHYEIHCLCSAYLGLDKKVRRRDLCVISAALAWLTSASANRFS